MVILRADNSNMKYVYYNCLRDILLESCITQAENHLIISDFAVDFYSKYGSIDKKLITDFA